MRHKLAQPARCAAALLVVALPILCDTASAQPPEEPQADAKATLLQLMSAEVRSVFGASRYLERVIDAPATVSIVTSDEIERFGYASLADILRGVRGITVNSDRNYSYVGVRGAARPGDYNTRVLILLDGHRLNDNVYDHAPLGTEFPLDVELIERVEIIRGPLSTMYGTNALFAVVNVVTRRGRAMPRVSGAVEAGNLGTRRIRGTYAQPLAGGGDVLLSATGFATDGRQDLEFPLLAHLGAAKVHPDLDADEFGQVFGTIRAGAFMAQGLVGSRRKGIPTGAYGTRLDDPRTETRDTRAYLNLQYMADWRGTSMRVRGAYDFYKYAGDYVYPDGEGSLVEHDGSRGQWWSAEVSGVRRAGPSHLVTGGLELRGNGQQDQFAEYDTGEVAVDDRRDSFVWSLFAQDEITLRPGLLLNAAVGLDHFPTFGSHGTYRGALIVKPASDQSWKLMYGTAFRAPNAYELYYYARPAGQADLQPERVSTLELIWEAYLHAGLRVSGTLFRNRLDDEISQLSDPAEAFGVYFANGGRLRAEGFGTEVEGVLRGAIHAFGAYTFARAHETSGSRAPNTPRHTFSGRLTAPLGELGFGGLEVRQLSSRLAINGASIPAVTVTRVSVNSRRFGPGLRLRLTLDNLFNVNYTDPGGEEHPDPLIPQDGRTARLRLAWEF